MQWLLGQRKILSSRHLPRDGVFVSVFLLCDYCDFFSPLLMSSINQMVFKRRKNYSFAVADWLYRKIIIRFLRIIRDARRIPVEPEWQVFYRFSTLSVFLFFLGLSVCWIICCFSFHLNQHTFSVRVTPMDEIQVERITTTSTTTPAKKKKMKEMVIQQVNKK